MERGGKFSKGNNGKRIQDNLQDENKEEKGERENTSGFIFMCSEKTKSECFQLGVFGLSVKPNFFLPFTKLFLYDTDSELLHGIYLPTTNDRHTWYRDAFEGKLPFQVGFQILKECLPLHLPKSELINAIQEKQECGLNFRPELSDKQVEALCSQLRPICNKIPFPRFYSFASEPRCHCSPVYDCPGCEPNCLCGDRSLLKSESGIDGLVGEDCAIPPLDPYFGFEGDTIYQLW